MDRLALAQRCARLYRESTIHQKLYTVIGVVGIVCSLTVIIEMIEKLAGGQSSNWSAIRLMGSQVWLPIKAEEDVNIGIIMLVFAITYTVSSTLLIYGSWKEKEDFSTSWRLCEGAVVFFQILAAIATRQPNVDNGVLVTFDSVFGLIAVLYTYLSEKRWFNCETRSGDIIEDDTTSGDCYEMMPIPPQFQEPEADRSHLPEIVSDSSDTEPQPGPSGYVPTSNDSQPSSSGYIPTSMGPQPGPSGSPHRFIEPQPRSSSYVPLQRLTILEEDEESSVEAETVTNEQEQQTSPQGEETRHSPDPPASTLETAVPSETSDTDCVEMRAVQSTPEPRTPSSEQQAESLDRS